MNKQNYFFSLFIYLTLLPSFAQANQEFGAVASANPLATRAGVEILQNGGNAFDAAIAVASTLSVVEPAMSGLGGYSSTLIYDAKKKEIHYLNGSGKFPLKTNSDLMRSPTKDYLKNRVGPKSISSPGNLNSWNEMHKKYGQSSWDNLFKSAIYYAENGFPLPPYTARLIASSFDEFSDYSKTFYSKNGVPLQKGELLIQKDLAKTYQLIAKEGVKAFYHGKIAKAIDQQMKKSGSFLSIEDLQLDQAEWWEPIKTDYKGYDIYTMGTPGNGFVANYILEITKHFPVQKHNSLSYLHILAEALKESSKVRLNYSGSPDEKENIINNILADKNTKLAASSIDLNKASTFNWKGTKGSNNTTHFVIVDKWGNMVSSTQTLGLGFGSKIMVEGTGIWMNNSMAFSDFEPKGNPMDVLPGKYKLSSNSPIIIIKDGKPWAALGTPGGHTIPQNSAQIIMNLIDFKMNMQQAIDAPKIAFFDDNNVICTEKPITDAVNFSLEKMGHEIDNENIANYIGISGKIGNAMGIKIINNNGNSKFDIGIDKRKEAWTNIYDNFGLK